MGQEPFDTECALASQGTLQNQVWEMLSKRASYADNIIWWWQTTGVFGDPEGGAPKSLTSWTEHEHDLYPPFKIQNGTSRDGANFPGPPAKSWCWRASAQQVPIPSRFYKKFGAGLPLFKMRTFWLNTTWDSQSPGTVVTSTTEVNASLSPPGAYSASGVEGPLPPWVCSSLSTPGSMRDEPPPNAVIAIWVSTHVHSKIIIVTSLEHFQHAKECTKHQRCTISFNHYKNSIR